MDSHKHPWSWVLTFAFLGGVGGLQMSPLVFFSRQQQYKWSLSIYKFLFLLISLFHFHPSFFSNSNWASSYHVIFHIVAHHSHLCIHSSLFWYLYQFSNHLSFKYIYLFISYWTSFHHLFFHIYSFYVETFFSSI